MPDREKIPYSMNSLLTAVVQQAQEDGRISSEESELIARIQIDAREFEMAIVEAKKQGSSNIYEVFEKIKDKIISNATDVARQDGIITDDEQAIINKLINELSSYQLE